MSKATHTVLKFRHIPRGLTQPTEDVPNLFESREEAVEHAEQLTEQIEDIHGEAYVVCEVVNYIYKHSVKGVQNLVEVE